MINPRKMSSRKALFIKQALGVLLVVAFANVFTKNVSAATITVTNNGNSGAGTLRQATIDAADGDTIEFNLGAGSETITISSYLYAPWGKGLTIDGDNSAGSGTDITIQVATPSVSTYPVIQISTGAKTTTLKNLTMRGGDATTGSGGTIYMYSSGASLVLENCVVKDGRGRFGAGIWANDFTSLTIDNCTFQDNDSQEHGSAARIDSFSGTVNITNSTFQNNNATATGGNYYGGAIYFYNNSAQGTVSIDKSTFSGNSIYSDGAGIYAKNISSLSISNSTFTNNTNGSGTGNGGGIYAYNVPTLRVSNSTFTGNTCKYFGGAMYIGGSGTVATLTNDTITNNSSSYYDYDGIYLSSATLYMKNTILADHAGYDFNNSSGTIHDNGYNIVEVSNNYTWSGTGDLTGNQTNLNISSSLADNSTVFGTQTLGLSSGSVAINAGDSASNNGVTVTNRDQRGFYRTDTVDIGAYEYNGSASPVYTLTYTAGDNGSITGTTPQIIASGEDGAAVSAVPATGYHFVDWSDSSTDNPRTDTNVTDNLSVTANFAIDTFDLAYAAGEHGSISGTTSQTVNYGTDGSTVTAVPDSNYAFVKWSDDSVENPRTDLNVTENITVTATFEIIDPNAPVKSTFIINNDDAYTNSKDVSLSIAATDDQNDVAYMMISNSVLFAGAEWVAYAAEYEWEVTDGDGEKNVYIKFKDSVGNESLTYSDSIILDTAIELSVETDDDTDLVVNEEGKRETRNQRPTFSGTGEPGATVTITINSDPIVGTTTVGEDGTWSWTPDENIPLGEHNVTIVIEDPAGNTKQVGYVLGILDDELADSGENIFIPIAIMVLGLCGVGVYIRKENIKNT